MLEDLQDYGLIYLRKVSRARLTRLSLPSINTRKQSKTHQAYIPPGLPRP